MTATGEEVLREIVESGEGIERYEVEFPDVTPSGFYVESGEGIERTVTRPHAPCTKRWWNPVKELKGCTYTIQLLLLKREWNPVKELKDIS